MTCLVSCVCPSWCCTAKGWLSLLLLTFVSVTSFNEIKTRKIMRQIKDNGRRYTEKKEETCVSFPVIEPSTPSFLYFVLIAEKEEEMKWDRHERQSEYITRQEQKTPKQCPVKSHVTGRIRKLLLSCLVMQVLALPPLSSNVFSLPSLVQNVFNKK